MSINALANSAAARRTDVGQADGLPASVSEIAAAAATPPDKAPAGRPVANGVNTTLNVLFGYMPTEVVTLYVAVTSALQSPAGAGAGPDPAAAAAASLNARWIAFWCFLAVTPVVVWVVYATKLRAASKPLPTEFAVWPVWEMFAALLAFFTWAFALPDTPFKERFPEWYSPGLASIAVLLGSTLLGLLAPLFQRKLEVPP